MVSTIIKRSLLCYEWTWFAILLLALYYVDGSFTNSTLSQHSYMVTWTLLSIQNCLKDLKSQAIYTSFTALCIDLNRPYGFSTNVSTVCWLPMASLQQNQIAMCSINLIIWSVSMLMTFLLWQLIYTKLNKCNKHQRRSFN